MDLPGGLWVLVLIVAHDSVELILRLALKVAERALFLLNLVAVAMDAQVDSICLTAVVGQEGFA